jgi:hypothetical protein
MFFNVKKYETRTGDPPHRTRSELPDLIELDYLTEGLFYLPSVGPPKEVNCTDKSSPEGKTRPAMVYSYSMIDMKGQKVMMTVWDGYGPGLHLYLQYVV